MPHSTHRARALQLLPATALSLIFGLLLILTGSLSVAAEPEQGKESAAKAQTAEQPMAVATFESSGEALPTQEAQAWAKQAQSSEARARDAVQAEKTKPR